MRPNPYEISKTFSFDAAHFLPRVPDGHKCARMHGHTYHATVSLKRDDLEEAGWVLDYGDLGRFVKPLIERLDHRTLNEIEGLENPTAEQIARWLYDRLVGNVPFLDSVEVKETPATAASYRRNAGGYNFDRRVASISSRVPCPVCDAAVGQWCETGSSGTLVHRRRVSLASSSDLFGRKSHDRYESLKLVKRSLRRPEVDPVVEELGRGVKIRSSHHSKGAPFSSIASTWHRSGGGWRRAKHNPDSTPQDVAFFAVERILDGDLRAASELAEIKLPISLGFLVDDVVALAKNMDAESARFTNAVVARENGLTTEAQFEAARGELHRADRALRKAATELRRQVAPEPAPRKKGPRPRAFVAPGDRPPQAMPMGRFVPLGPSGAQRRKLGARRMNSDEELRGLERTAEHDPAARDALSVALIRAGRGEAQDHAFWSVRVLDRNRKTIYETTLLRSEEHDPPERGPKLPILWSTTQRLVVTAPENVRARLLRRGNWIVYWKSEQLRDGRHAVLQGAPHTYLLTATGARPLSDGSMSAQAVNWGRPDRKIIKNQ